MTPLRRTQRSGRRYSSAPADGPESRTIQGPLAAGRPKQSSDQGEDWAVAERRHRSGAVTHSPLELQISE
jgi:hypothetical protein